MRAASFCQRRTLKLEQPRSFGYAIGTGRCQDRFPCRIDGDCAGDRACNVDDGTCIQICVNDEFDLDGTIKSTAEHGYLDVKMRPERRNAVKLVMFFDVGGSMDDHIRVVEELFSAARAEFKHMEYYYFHNCLYESVWKDNRRRHAERIPTFDVLHTYGPDYRIVFVGDATMSPYEIAMAGGSVEHWNEEAGAVWMQRVLEKFPKTIWLNPEREDRWRFTQSTQMLNEIMGGRMYPLTLKGLDEATRELSR